MCVARRLISVTCSAAAGQRPAWASGADCVRPAGRQLSLAGEWGAQLAQLAQRAPTASRAAPRPTSLASDWPQTGARAGRLYKAAPD